jgi:hypothetical protein
MLKKLNLIPLNPLKTVNLPKEITQRLEKTYTRVATSRPDRSYSHLDRNGIWRHFKHNEEVNEEHKEYMRNVNRRAEDKCIDRRKVSSIILQSFSFFGYPIKSDLPVIRVTNFKPVFKK